VPSIARLSRLLNLSAIEIAVAGNAAAGTVVPGAVLPKGARPVLIQSLGGATGGASPTMDIGASANPAIAALATADPDYFANELDADTAGAAIALTGVGANIVALAPVQITAGVGASAAAGGTHRCILFYTRNAIPGGT